MVFARSVAVSAMSQLVRVKRRGSCSAECTDRCASPTANQTAENRTALNRKTLNRSYVNRSYVNRSFVNRSFVNRSFGCGNFYLVRSLALRPPLESPCLTIVRITFSSPALRGWKGNDRATTTPLADEAP